MPRNSPLVTLLAGGALGAGLLIASMAATPEEPAADAEPAVAETETPAAEPTATEAATEAPEETPEPTTPPPEPPAPAEPETYVGYVDGGGASVAVIIDGAEAIAYVCDGASREAWLAGTASDGRIELTGERGSLSAAFDGTVVQGETTVDGQNWTFTIAQVDPPEGLYRFADTVSGGAEVVGGWIVLPDGTQVGAVSVDGETRPAEPIDVGTGRVTVEGDDVQAELQTDGSL
ncbi:hypothetical protein [Jiangella mangrovi]|uniref:Serine/threonine-protein kinase n=1 Tax=Jiangella mangrovi TaxID=1524084 RepID=A0A7W9GNY9_9ACTN|nr:hypothetical protein [Jiangella mangrovi]MBB5787335.1 serine/threonine-protein kinase [Jiangella mangrovi]